MRPLAHYTVLQNNKRILHGPIYTQHLRLGAGHRADLRLPIEGELSVELTPLRVTAHSPGLRVRNRGMPLGKPMSVRPNEDIYLQDYRLRVVPCKHTTKPLAHSDRAAPTQCVLRHQGRDYSVPEDVVFLVGSGKGMDLTVKDHYVSACHLSIHRVNGQWLVQDQSTNGTQVGATHVKNGVAKLMPGTWLQLSPTTRLRFYAPDQGPQILAHSLAMQALLKELEPVAQTDHPIVLLGEPGVGKSQLAAWIHICSLRAQGPFESYNAATLLTTLQGHELFGHRAGAFTGATEDRPGVLMTAQGGTLFLDEVADLPASVQAAMLVVLQDKQFRPLGSDRPQDVNVRLITATNQNLQDTVQSGRCRADFVARLGHPFEVPPLRQRPEDILPLFQKRCADSGRAQSLQLSKSAEEVLQTHGWPGNVRELFLVADRLGVLSPTTKVTARKLQDAIDRYQSLFDGPNETITTKKPSRRRRLRRWEITRLLRETHGNAMEAARRAGIPMSTFRRWMQDHEVDPQDFKP